MVDVLGVVDGGDPGEEIGIVGEEGVGGLMRDTNDVLIVVIEKLFGGEVSLEIELIVAANPSNMIAGGDEGCETCGYALLTGDDGVEMAMGESLADGVVESHIEDGGMATGETNGGSSETAENVVFLFPTAKSESLSDKGGSQHGDIVVLMHE